MNSNVYKTSYAPGNTIKDINVATPFKTSFAIYNIYSAQTARVSPQYFANPHC